MTTVNKKLKKTASGAITWSVIVTQILSPVSLSLIPANSFASSGNKDVTQIYASDEHANKVASFAASAGQSLANNNASSFAVNTLSTQATKEVVDWLQQYGNARIKLNVDDSFSLKDSSFDFLYPWLDTQDYVLFSQTSLHRTDDRNQTNIGLGIRHFTPDNAMLGANVFYDYDLSRSHSRAGFGVEYWRDYFRLGVNTYFGLSDWKNSRDIDDYLERPANGWDFSAEGWLPAYPQLGASIQFEKYYGKNVGLFGSDNLQENPYAVTGGISYTPVPLIKFSAQHKQGQSNTHDTTFGVEFNYRPGVSLAEQLSSDNVAVMREVQNRRYDFVERNNNIVLEYKKKHALKISLPESVQGEGESIIPVTLTINNASGGIKSVQWNARQRETVTAPSLGAVEEISAGVYRSVLAAGSQAGTVRVTAKVQGKTFTLSIKQTATTEPDSEVSAVLTAAPAEQVVGYNINLQLAVKDSQGNAITGDNTLSFYALNQAEGVEFGTVTEKDGVYSATVTSKRAGKITIGVKSDSHDFSGVKKEITFIEDRQQVTFSQFEASQNNALADGKQRNMVTVSLADRFGNVVPGYAVTLSLPAGITQVGGEHAVSTDENGNAIFALISSTPGSYVITAHAGSQMSTELTVTFASNMTGASLSLTPESSSLISNIPANGKDAAVLDVQLTNTNASVNGQKIQLITSSEGLSVPTNIVTDSTGHVSVPLTTVKAGEYTVTARVTDGSHSVESGSVKLTFVPDVASAELNMSVSKQEIVADGSENATVNIQLVDANNNAFTGEVDLTITPSTGASLTSSNLQLDAHGQATTQFTASKSGQYTIQAEYVLDGKRITASQNIDAVTDVKGAVLEITSSASSAVVSDTNNLVFTLLLKSKSGEALSGRALNVKTSGPSKYGALVVDKTTVTTDENGQATVSVHGRTVGSYKLTATLNELGSDVSAVKSFSLYADDANGVLTLTKDPGYETNDGSPVGIYARFVDHFGNPLSGTVEFSAGSEDSPDSQRVKMEPATVTLHWTGNAASEFSTYESGYHWIKAKITNSKNTYEKTIRTYVVKLPEKDS